MSSARFAVMVLVGAEVLGGWVHAVSADECKDDSSCPRGFTCEVTGGSACAGAASAFCPEGAECDPPAPAPPPDCKPIVYRSCVPGGCMNDSDCAEGMVCLAEDVGTCSSEPSAPCEGGICPPRTPPSCTSEVSRSCVPQYLLPCGSADDCGAGFTCEPQQQCGCSGSAGAPTPGTSPAPAIDGGAAVDAGSATPADAGVAEDRARIAPPTCSCTPTKEKYCKPIERSCRVDSDCPALWSCKSAVTTDDVATCDAAPPGADAGTCRAAQPIPPQLRCVPPYDGLNAGIGHDAVDEEGTGGRPTGGSSGSMSAPGSAPVRQDGDGAPENGNVAPPRHVSACAVATAGTRDPSGLWTGVLSLLAAGLFMTRCRRAR